MNKNLDLVADELFGKIRTQFPKIKLRDEESQPTDEPDLARFFEFDFETEDFKAKAFQLRYSLPYDVIFDLDGNIKKKTENKNTEKFIETMTSVYIDSAFSSNITEDLMVFAEKTKINKKVIDMAIKTIDIIKTGGEL